jgi:hypothetical protein
MAPKPKAMKKPLVKGKAKPTPLVKGNSKSPMKVMKSSLKKNLEKLGKMTLKEKVQKASEDAETPQEAAANLKDMLGKQEHSRVWSRYQTALKGKSKKEQKEFQNKSKAEKGMEAALSLVKSTVPKFFHFQESVDHTRTLDKREKWQSEKKMLEHFGEDDFWRHLDSGRIISREDPWTTGVWEYCDKGDISKTTSVKQKRQWTTGQEYTLEKEDEENWEHFNAKDLQSHLQEVGKGEGKGKSLVKGHVSKGKGKSTGKQQLALEDGDVDEKSEEELWKEVLAKAKRGKDQAAVAKDDFEAALKKADLAKRLTKGGKKDSENTLEGLNKKVKVVKDLLAKKEKAMPFEKAKSLLLDLMGKIKEVRGETRELNQLANKANSKASKS